MAESILVIADHAGEELHELRRKFHPHHDYLNLIIPSTWLLFGGLVADFYFYRADHLKHILRRLLEIGPLLETASTSLEFFLALFLFVVVFSVIYVVGHMINGLSALLLDRLIVKKLLKYPFELYQRRLTDATSDDRTLFRNAVLESSYLIFCLNLIPVMFLEVVVALFAFRVPALQPWARAHSAEIALLLLIFFYLHFGWPTFTKAKRYPEADPRAAIHYREFALYHIVFFAVFFFIEVMLIAGLGRVAAILLLPIANVIIGLSERGVRRGEEYRSDYARRFYFYLRLSFTNALYFAAKLSGYGDIPSQAIVSDARSAAGASCGNKDFFWMAYLAVQNHGGAASQTAYHFLAAYGMVRNLCNATALVLVGSVIEFWIRWPEEQGAAVVIWCVGLCFLMYALFARYLYLYASYFSKYTLRVAAHVYRGTYHLVTPETTP